jgi:hypothetical protein
MLIVDVFIVVKPRLAFTTCIGFFNDITEVPLNATFPVEEAVKLPEPVKVRVPPVTFQLFVQSKSDIKLIVDVTAFATLYQVIPLVFKLQVVPMLNVPFVVTTDPVTYEKVPLW